MTTSYHFSHGLNFGSLFNISVAILIRVSPIAACIVLVTLCLVLYCLHFAWILYFKEEVRAGATPTLTYQKPLTRYDSFESSSLNSISLTPLGTARTLILLHPFH